MWNGPLRKCLEYAEGGCLQPEQQGLFTVGCVTSRLPFRHGWKEQEGPGSSLRRRSVEKNVNYIPKTCFSCCNLLWTMCAPVLMVQRWKVDIVSVEAVITDDAVPNMSSRWNLIKQRRCKPDEHFCALKTETLGSCCAMLWFTVVLRSDVQCCEFAEPW